ncbi:MAG: hypothetical protein CMK09_18860 [Ponticaulis sp.]|nr:hypothetical protein [Ponticaulis sp.]|tara:strand:+ start:145438 stop:146340 length:903 start_codon:yes stop_codon:yes gene_type:complete
MTRAVESQSKQSQKSVETDAPSQYEKSPRLQLVDGPIAPDARIGDRMRAVRLSKGLEIDEVARYLRLRRDYIEAIESMQVARLPKGFVNPYIRDYARVLELDPNETVDAFNEQCGALAQAVPSKVTIPQGNGNGAAIFRVVAVIIGLVIAGAIGWFGYKFVSTPDETPVATQTPGVAFESDYAMGARTPVVADPVLEAATRTMNFEIQANRRAWIDIRGADGTQMFERQMRPGEPYKLRVGAGWTVSTQDAGAFTWMINGEQVALLGEDNQALYTISVDNSAAELKAQLEAAEAAEATPE